ncbi:MAG: LPXTG cell wall anchor domain-containing protein, partial [Acidobacteriota bacterium]
EDEAPTPTELPETGMGENILSLLGVGSLAGVTSAYIASRRK